MIAITQVSPGYLHKALSEPVLSDSITPGFTGVIYIRLFQSQSFHDSHHPRFTGGYSSGLKPGLVNVPNLNSGRPPSGGRPCFSTVGALFVLKGNPPFP